MRLLTTICFLSLAFAAPAKANSFTFTLQDKTDGTLSKSYSNFSDAAVDNWIASFQPLCDRSINPQQRNPAAEIWGKQAVQTCSREKVFQFIMQATVNIWIANMKSYNAAMAAQKVDQSKAAITP